MKPLDRFYGWHPCPICGEVGYGNTLNNELHSGETDYPQTFIEFCQSCSVDLAVTYPTADGLPIVQVGPNHSEGIQAWQTWEKTEAIPRAQDLEDVIVAGGDVYAVAAADPRLHVGKPSVPDAVPACMSVEAE